MLSPPIPIFNLSWHQKNLLESPFTVMRTLLTKISPEYSLEELMQTLKLQYLADLMQRTDTGNDPDAGRTKGEKRRDDRK